MAKAVTSRGFTGHEQLDDVGLIHMNGRVYDPGLGRFISADPQVQFASNLQSYNRYSYVHNNPLSYTDPSGFGIWKKFKRLIKSNPLYRINRAARQFVRDNKYAQMAIQIAAAATGQWYIVALTSAALTGINGGNVGDIVKSGLIAGITAGMFQGVGEIVGNVGMFDPTKMLLHGLVGGASSAMMGGGFKAGFMAAGFTAGVAPGIQGSGFGKGGQMIMASLVGGTAAEIGGGKFANGAVTGAMSYAFNQAKQGAKNDVFTGERRVTRATGESRTHWNGIDSVEWQEVSVDEVISFMAKKPIPELSVKSGMEYGYREYEHQVGVESYQAVSDGSSWGGNVTSTQTKPILWMDETIWKRNPADTTQFSRRRYGACVGMLCWN